MVDQDAQERQRAAIELLYFAYRAFTLGPDRVLAQRGLGRVHHRILYFVARNPGISVSGLLQTLAITKQALHAPLRQLVGMGLIESGSDPGDARIRQLSLSADGKRLEARLTATQAERLAAAFTAAGPAAEAGWFAVMRQLADRGAPEDGAEA